ncbi:hypothetical protein NJH49_11735 [Stenotrophomonas maltophilia]|uniref:hypothetical protein n=1 Tax=Stenotrophomonas maltophilia TaxID=40324 RepID=UPI00209792CC|nr:hypothetical protein [Stenotrophomonas maltophilia]MCO7398080.1 hypothetical protein [Stenotrophomonas maltophilia]MCO7412058.1 hypothetical protein [Stenotrophomonas maltophilia]HDS1651429.1 hypothetical protein [Stenotrophomonas maltophilia]
MDNREPEGTYGDVPRVQGIEVAAAPPEPEAATDWSMLPLTRGDDDSAVMQALSRMRREPALLFTTAYLLVSLLGLWCSFWFYRGFELSILDYLQPSDFLVAGIRDPAYALLLAAGVLLVLLVSWPDTLRMRNAAKLEQLRARNWAWRAVLMRSVLTSWEGVGLRPLTAMTLAVAAFMAIGAANYVQVRGQQIRNEGRGEVIRLQLNGDAAPLPGTARLLGSSSAFLFVWWPQQRRAEASPIAAVRKLQAVAVAAPAPKGRAGD